MGASRRMIVSCDSGKHPVPHLGALVRRDDLAGARGSNACARWAWERRQIAVKSQRPCGVVSLNAISAHRADGANASCVRLGASRR